MGRKSKGAKCTFEALRLELGYLLKHYLKPGCVIQTNFSWTKRWRSESEGTVVASVKLSCKLLHDSSEGWVMLEYTQGEIPRCDRIDLVSVPSNLGKGRVLYFVCPETGRKCRMLYRCYDSQIWKSREAYQRRIYYECQHSSKMNGPNDRWWHIERLLPKIQTPIRRSTTYAGKLTRRTQRVNALWHKQENFERLRWGLDCMPLSLRNEVKAGKLQVPYG